MRIRRSVVILLLLTIVLVGCKGNGQDDDRIKSGNGESSTEKKVTIGDCVSFVKEK